MKFSDYNLLQRWLVFFLAFVIAIPMISMPIDVQAASLRDIRGHWAEQDIYSAISKGFAAGYTDGTFRPDRPVTRAEFTAMINRALGNTGSASISFSDVPTSEWYYKEVAKGMSAAFVGGYDDNTFRPENHITRQEAAAMLARIIPAYGTSANLKNYSDYSSVSDWAVSSLSKVCGKGYMGAYKDGKLHPLDNLTRAQTAKILCDLTDSESIVSGTTTIKTDGTTLSNRIYTNDITLDSALGNGEATLSNCVVLGTLYVYGGGQNTVKVRNSRVANALVEKSSSPVRLLAEGESVIANTTAGKTAILETSGLSGGLYGTGYNQVDIKGSADTTLRGSFSRVRVNGSSAKVALESGTINTLDVDYAGRNSDITVSSVATVSTANVNSSASFHGSGIINTMNANTSGITYETRPRNVRSSNSNYTPNNSDSTTNGISITPRYGATDVGVRNDIVLTFDSSVTKFNNTTLTSSNIGDVIKLRKRSSSGTTVDFNASISSNKRVITITPRQDLDTYTDYYVTIDRNAILIGNTGNASFSSYFSTNNTTNGSSTMDGITISPGKGDTKVSTDTNITLTFDRTITEYDGSTIKNNRLYRLIELRRDSSSGTSVNFEATYDSSRKRITIDPTSNLDENTKYYVKFDKNTFKTSNGGNAEFYSYFTTGDSSSDVSYYPRNNDYGVSTNIRPEISFSNAVEPYVGSKTLNASYLDSSVITFKDEDGSKVAFSAEISPSKRTITIRPSSSLKDGHKYTLGIVGNKLRTQSDRSNIPDSSVSWYVGSTTPTISNFTGTSDGSSITATMTPSTAGTLYTIVLPSTATAPSASQVMSGTDASGVAVSSTFKASSSVTANANKTFTYTGLASGTSYTVYAVLSGSLNNSSVCTMTRATTGTAPAAASIVSATPAESSISATVSASAEGTLYTVLLPSGDTAPSAAQIVAGKDASNNAVASTRVGSSAVIAGASKSFTYSGLTESTNYMIYAVLQTSSGLTPVVSLSKSTTAAAPPIVPDATLSTVTVKTDTGATSSPTIAASMAVTVPYYTSSVTINTTSSTGDTITIDDKSSPQTLTLGDSELTVTIRAIGDYKTTKVYKLTITKADPDLSIANIYVNSAKSSSWSVNVLRTEEVQKVNYVIEATDKQHAVVTPSSDTITFQKDETEKPVTITVKNGPGSKQYTLTVTMDKYQAPTDPTTPTTP